LSGGDRSSRVAYGQVWWDLAVSDQGPTLRPAIPGRCNPLGPNDLKNKGDESTRLPGRCLMRRY